MPKRSLSAMFPLLSGPASEGLSLRDQIYKTCLAAIVDGRLAEGARLPSARQLALDWRISRNTVDDAIARLQAEGFLVRRIGAGTFVAARARIARRAGAQRRRPSVLGRKALAAVSAWGRNATSSYLSASVPKAVAFLAGMPALDAFPLVLWRRLAARRLRVGGGGLLGYFPSLGHVPLREATARHLASTRGIDCDPGQVMILNSSMQAVDLVARVLLESLATPSGSKIHAFPICAPHWPCPVRASSPCRSTRTVSTSRRVHAARRRHWSTSRRHASIRRA